MGRNVRKNSHMRIALGMVLGFAIATSVASDVAWAKKDDKKGGTFDVKELCDRQYASGLEFKKNSRFVDAEETFVGVIEACPDYLNAYLQLGNISISLNNYEKAIGYYEKAIALDDSNLDVKEALAYAYTSNNRLDDAEDIYLSLLEKDPNRQGAIQNLAYNYEQQGKAAEAAVLYTRAFEADSTNTQLAERLARLYLDNKSYAQALTFHELLVQRFPENNDFYLKLAHFHFKMKNWDEVVAMYEVLLDRDEDPAKQLYYRQILGQAYNAQGNSEKSMEVYDFLIAAPDCAWQTFYNYADMLLDDMKFSKAADVISRGVKVHPGEGCLQYMQGEIFEKRAIAAQESQNWDQARQLFKEAKGVFASVTSGTCAGNAAKQVPRQDQLLERLNKLQERSEQGD